MRFTLTIDIDVSDDEPLTHWLHECGWAQGEIRHAERATLRDETGKVVALVDEYNIAKKV